MATGSFEFYSNSLSRAVSFNIIIPNDILPIMIEGNKHFDRPMKTLYLLTGFSAANNDWLFQGNAAELALKYNLAIVMPAGENSFYLDRKGTGFSYATYVGKELVEYTRKTFGLSERMEDTFIAGLSMGGFGALHTALQFNNTFSKTTALSSALIIHKIANMPKDAPNDGIADYDYYRTVFGDLTKVTESDNNPEVLVNKLKAAGERIPGIYLACGTEDFLYEDNLVFKSFLEKAEVPFKYEEGPGIHDFVFWNEYVKRGVEWMLED